tara:strand:+ start:235 stop:531 length:297 start_codon:yes stop_codon:yes gene_type:complete
MQKTSRHIKALYLALLFLVLISAPTVIMSIDSSIDVSSFYNVNEEEEHENLKIVFKTTALDSQTLFEESISSNHIGFSFKNYSKPYLSVVSPPPENVL